MDAGQRVSQEDAPARIQWQHAARQGDRSVTSSGSGGARRWTVIASGLLILALGLVVIYTERNVFLSPIALVVVAAIGLTALLLQVRFRHDLPNVRTPLWLNIVGLFCATVALFADYLRMSVRALTVAAFGAVVCFGISGLVILHALRRQREPPR
jgi:uncharacterized membrane protein